VVSNTEIAEQIVIEGVATPARSHSLRRLLARGGSTLGAASVLERGFGFIANVLAARAAGPQTFGAYAVVLATAGTVANYAGAGIGSTANRFSGQFPVNSKGYRGFLRAIILVSLASASLGAVLMLAGAGPFARTLLHNEWLVGVLRIAALSSGALILLECCRGLLIGQQKFQGLLLLSVVSGIGMILILPVAARIGAGAMIGGHATVALLAVAACACFSRRLGIVPPQSESGNVSEGPGVRQIVAFGAVQLSTVVGINIASWWLASLVARSDTSLLQMGMYAVANQFRGLASIAPGLLAQVSYPLLTAESGRDYGGPDRVMLVNTFLSITLAVILAGLIVVLLPWILLYLYGASYAHAEIPAVLLLATAISHMSSTPSANRLSIVNLRALGVINIVWAVMVIVLGIWLVPVAGAGGAAGAFLISHLFSQAAVLVVLKQAGILPPGILKLSLTGIIAAVAFALLACARVFLPTRQITMTALLLACVTVFILTLLRFGQKQRWLPMLSK
jgi:O-antigen/teichoic acid export membrane protein